MRGIRSMTIAVCELVGGYIAETGGVEQFVAGGESIAAHSKKVRRQVTALRR